MSGMRHIFAASLLLAGCLAETEDESCLWQERLTHASAPPGQCARYTPEPGFEEHTRFLLAGESCDDAVSCVVVQPGESADILGSAETRNEVHVAVEYGDCSYLPPCP